MTERAESDDQDTPDTGGVFSNLPASRPGTRSPRRDRGGRGPKSAAKADAAAKRPAQPKAASPSAGASSEAPRATAKPKAADRPVQEAPEPQQPEPEGGESRGGIEDLAWAGIAAAAEAATLGVRLASRAMGAVRGGADRR